MGEYIEREATRPDEFCVGVSCQECPFLKDPINGGCRVDDFIMSIPAADVQPVKHGKWKLLGEPPWYVRECSECGGKWHHWHEYELPRYCNNCGAKMDGET